MILLILGQKKSKAMKNFHNYMINYKNQNNNLKIHNFQVI